MGLTIAAVCALAIVAVVRGRYLVAAVVTAGAFLLHIVTSHILLYFLPQDSWHVSPSWQLPLVVVLLLPIIGRGTIAAPKALEPVLALRTPMGMSDAARCDAVHYLKPISRMQVVGLASRSYTASRRPYTAIALQAADTGKRFARTSPWPYREPRSTPPARSSTTAGSPRPNSHLYPSLRLLGPA